jgi:hypothetical protein
MATCVVRREQPDRSLVHFGFFVNTHAYAGYGGEYHFAPLYSYAIILQTCERLCKLHNGCRNLGRIREPQL